DVKSLDFGNLHIAAIDFPDLAQGLDGVLRDPTQIPDADRQTLETELENRFGTPANPKVNVTGLSTDTAEQKALELAVADLKLDDKTLAMGSTRYRVHCLHCHGVPGDGRGATSRWVNPHPRDFRSGLFKFQSVDQTKKANRPPSRGDLLRTVREGIEGTAMPTFNLLTDEELDSLVSYVIHLSIRGRAEAETINDSFEWEAKDDKVASLMRKKDGNLKKNLEIFANIFVNDWFASNQPDSAIKVRQVPFDPNDVEALKASVKRGHEIFTANPSEETIKHYVTLVLPREIEKELQKAKDEIKKAQAGALKKAIGEAEDAIILEIRDEMVKEVEKKKGVKLASIEIDNIHAEAAKSAKVKPRLDAQIPEITAAVEKNLPQVPKDLEQQIRKKLEPGFEEKAANALKAANCKQCHVEYGRQARFRFDDFGTLTRPNNLTQGVFRGGRRPVDLYFRIHSGIPGTDMVLSGGTFAGNEEYIWDIVNFITVLPYPAMRDKLGLKID
ncbi:MAG: cytochrome c, partial [Planctomycetes bacterium]|nr:cytochrome c [Planctomycetota bacterium]